MAGIKYFGKATEVAYGAAVYGRARSGRPGVLVTPELYYKNYGAISTADPDGVAASQSVTVATTPLAVINGALASAGVATFSTPRNVVAAWTGTAVLTVTGTDEYGSIVTEASGSGTSFTGKKAFKTVTSCSFSANVTGATIGEGVVIGLPHRVDANGILVMLQDGAATTTTFVAAVTTSPATTTTGDVRGTVTFANAPNDTRVYALLYKIADPSSKVGAYGVLQSGSSDGA